MFCTDHASAVKDPVKPKAKQRAVPLADDAGESLTTTVTTTTTVLQRPRGAAYGRSKAAEDYAAGRLPTTQPVPVDILNAVIAASFAAVAELQESRREESSEGNKVSSGTATATVHTMSEWPGQAEGEGMDLEHFWNIVSMSFPEDHSSSWLQSLYAAITQHFSTGDKYTSLHRLGTASDKLQMETSDSIFGHLSEREKLAKLDPEKRFELQQNLMQHLALLSHSLPSTSFLVSESKQRHLVGIDDFLITSSSLVSIQENKKEDDSQLRVVFDGNERKECTYTINERSASCPSFLMDPASVNPFLLGPPPPSLTSCEETKSIDAASVQLILESWSKLSNEQSVFLWDREIISRDKQDELNFMIRSDQIYYQKFAEFVLPLLESLMTDRLSVCCSKGIEERSQWAALENVYRCQRIWKKVATLTASGMRELGIEAPPVAEVVPASWSVPVDGRPKPEEASGPSASDDSVCLVCFDGTSSEDNSILFCDGCNSSVHQACYGIAEVPEGQFFCDRCQAIQRLLDNDAIDFDPVLYGRDAINCCLCTSYHGGLKPTTDGRWVHLCCALWSQLAVIENLDDMAPVNVTPLRLQPTLSRDTRQSQLSEEGDVVRNGESKLELVESTVLQSEKVDSSAMVNELITDVCRVCRIAGGLVIRCSGDVACPVVFHPICGWFEGLYVKVHLNDPTFQGLDRGGLFPSGLVYTFCCLSHTPPEFSDYKLRKHQQILRRKFRLDERDLDIVPGQLRRKKKRRSVLMPAAVQRVTTSTVIAKELTPDVYDSSYCAACLAPIPDYVPPYLRNKNEAVAAAAASTVTLTVKCSDCGICLHQDCLPSKHVLPPAGDWKCTVCLFNEKDARCYCCPRRGGFFNTLAEGGWIHEYCANHMPVAKRTNLEGAIEVRSIPKEFRKQKCAFCNRKTGVCVRCSHLGCSVYFHALCGARNDRLYIRHEYESTVAFCVDHIPAGITWVSEGYWVDLHELTNLRLGLDKARLIADTVRRRDKLKRSLYKIEGESFALSFNRLLDRAMGRKGILNSPGNNTDLNELYYGSDGSCYSDEDIDHIKTSDFKADKEAAGGQDGAMAGIIVSTDVGELLISSTWISEDELKVPRKVKVTLSGLAIGRTDTLAYKEKEFKLTFLPKLTEELERNLKSNIYVRKSGDLSYLLKTLTTELAEYGRLSFKQFTEEMIRKGVEVKKPKVTRSSKVKFAEEKVEIKKSQDSGTLTVVEISDQLRSSVWTKLQLAVEGLPRSFHLDIPLLEEEEAYLVDWRPATDVVNLERRLQFILDSICDFKLDGPRAKRRKSEPMESRNIVEDFEEIPYDLIPYYDTMVRHPLSLAVIRSRLQSHTYSTLAAFANDVYEMLSNARFITGEDSTVKPYRSTFKCCSYS